MNAAVRIKMALIWRHERPAGILVPGKFYGEGVISFTPKKKKKKDYTTLTK